MKDRRCELFLSVELRTFYFIALNNDTPVQTRSQESTIRNHANSRHYLYFIIHMFIRLNNEKTAIVRLKNAGQFFIFSVENNAPR